MTFEQFMINLWEAFTTLMGGEAPAVILTAGVFVAIGVYIRSWLRNKIKSQENVLAERKAVIEQELSAKKEELRVQSRLVDANVSLNQTLVSMLEHRVASLEQDQTKALERAAEYLSMYKDIHSRYVETITVMAKQGTEMALLVQDRKHLQDTVALLTAENTTLRAKVQDLERQVAALRKQVEELEKNDNNL